MADKQPQRPNSRKGISNGKSTHYGDRDERHQLDIDTEAAILQLAREISP